MRVLLVGCGYVGQPLGTVLAEQGHEVFGLRRTWPQADLDLCPGVKPITADITQPKSLTALPKDLDWVVNLVSSTKGGVEEYMQVYLEGTRHLLAALSSHPLKKFVYTSSTSVYGQTDGSLVKEDSPAEPTAETSQILVRTEHELLQAAARGFPAIILRVSGIYGPERGHLFLQYLKNEARLSPGGERIINMVHREDVVGAILAALKSGRAGQIYNVSDDEPVTQTNFFRWLSETLGKWMPPYATENEEARRKRGLTNKKVSNRRLRMELGYQLRYPTFRQGYTAEITRLDRAGLLNIEPEPR